MICSSPFLFCRFLSRMFCVKPKL